ncbi:MAG: DUF4097 domain-containing protein [Ruminococcaceae bacterium]|nr:DUF4097 domain-containing protein [Oscillospiraceae bacterium]
MNKTTAVWIAVAVSLILLGAVIFLVAAGSASWDFAKLSGKEYETNTYEIIENFDNVSLKIDTADVLFLPSEDEKCRVVCYEETNMKHTVLVENGTLTVRANDSRKWYEHISWYDRGERLTVYLPQTAYATLKIEGSTGDVELPQDLSFGSIDIALSTGDVSCKASASQAIRIAASTGDIRLEGLSAASLALSVSTGDVTVTSTTCAGDVTISVSTGKVILSELTCKGLTSDGSTGDISLKNVIVAEKLLVERSTGDVRFEHCDADELSVMTNTGDVIGSLRSDKVFIVDTNTGSKEVPATTAGGRCEITTDTGDIRITIG